MPNPNAQFAMTPGALAQLGKIRPDYMPDVWAWQNRATQADNTTLADMMRAAQEEEQLSPIRVKRGQADLESVMVNTDRTRGLIDQDKEVTTQKRMDNELAQHLLPQKKVTEFAELVTKADDEQRKQAEIKVYQMMQSSDPKVRAMGQQLYPTLKAAIDKKFNVETETAGQLKVQGSANAAAAARNAQTIAANRELEQMRIDAGKYKKKNEETASGIISAVQAGKLTYEKAATSFEILSRVEEDPEKAKLYAELANKFGAEALKANQTRAGGKLDVGAVTGMPTTPVPSTGLGETPAPSAEPKPRPTVGLKEQQKEEWIVRAMKANPGMTREQVEAEGKKLGKF